MNKRKITGIVVSDKMQKTRVVAVDRLVKHPKYLKYYTATSKFKAHDERNEYKKGDQRGNRGITAAFAREALGHHRKNSKLKIGN